MAFLLGWFVDQSQFEVLRFEIDRSQAVRLLIIRGQTVRLHSIRLLSIHQCGRTPGFSGPAFFEAGGDARFYMLFSTVVYFPHFLVLVLKLVIFQSKSSVFLSCICEFLLHLAELGLEEITVLLFQFEFFGPLGVALAVRLLIIGEFRYGTVYQ